jgi:hypothetical protein
MDPNEIQKRKKLLERLAINYRWGSKPMPKEDKLVFKTVNGDAYYDENDVDSEPTYSEHIYKVDNLEDAYLGHL